MHVSLKDVVLMCMFAISGMLILSCGKGGSSADSIPDDGIFFPYESPRGSHSVALSFPDPVTIEPSSSAAFDIVVPGFSYDNITIKVNTTGGHFFESFQNIESI